MLDARPFDARVEPVAHLVLVVTVELATQEGGDVVRFDGMNRGAGEPVIDRVINAENIPEILATMTMADMVHFYELSNA